MKTLPIAVLALTATAAAQIVPTPNTAPPTTIDQLSPLGFGVSNGGGDSYPIVRLRDFNGDGFADAGETFPWQIENENGAGFSNREFSVMVRTVIERGNPTHYILATNGTKVVRAVDLNNNGQIEKVEQSTLWTGGGGPGSTDDEGYQMAVRRDSGRTIIYVCNNDGGTEGIVRLEDVDGDGTISANEQTQLVSPSLALPIVGTSVNLTTDNFESIQVMPSGKLLVYAQGPRGAERLEMGTRDPITGELVFTANHTDSWCWYTITDNTDTGGPATVEVFLNPTRYNGIPQFADFTPTGTRFPDPTIERSVMPGEAFNSLIFSAIQPGGGPAGETVILLATAAAPVGSNSDFGDINVDGDLIGGMIYRIVDLNGNGICDAGEINLSMNVSGSTWDNVPSIIWTDSFGVTQSTMPPGRIYGANGDANGALVYQVATNSAILRAQDANGNGFVEGNELTEFHIGFQAFPYSTGFGPFQQNGVELEANLLPGPFPTGVVPVGMGCRQTSNGLRPVMDLIGDASVTSGTVNQVRVLRVTPLTPVVLYVGTPLQAPVNLASAGLPFDCNAYLNPDTAILSQFVLSGTVAQWDVPLPNNANLVGFNLRAQGVVADSSLPTPIQLVTSNALDVTIQP